MTNKIIYSVNFLKEIATDIDELKTKISNLIASGVLKLGHPDAVIEFEDSDASDLPLVNGKIQLPTARQFEAGTHLVEINIHTLMEMENNLFLFSLDDLDGDTEIIPYIDFRTSKIKGRFTLSRNYRDTQGYSDQYDPTQVVFLFAIKVTVDVQNNTLNFDSVIEANAKAMTGEDDWGNKQYADLHQIGAFSDFSNAVKSISAMTFMDIYDKVVLHWILSNQNRLTKMISSSFLTSL